MRSTQQSGNQLPEYRSITGFAGSSRSILNLTPCGVPCCHGILTGNLHHTAHH
ncbi:MAG: hypothetical protein HZC44_02545 [Geobacter sp.]|nr:hypothetical protein [Geobacter sp.]